MTENHQSLVLLKDAAWALWISGNDILFPKPRLISESSPDKAFAGYTAVVYI